MNIVTCVYCGMEYPSGTPSHGAEVLTEHIKQCEKHPMRKLEQQNILLRKALVGLVGADTKGELENMEASIRIAQIPDWYGAITINAIRVLLDTL